MMQHEANEAIRIVAWLEAAIQDITPRVTEAIREGRQPGITFIISDTTIEDAEPDDDGRPRAHVSFDLWTATYVSWELTEAILDRALQNARTQAAAEIAALDLQRGPW